MWLLFAIIAAISGGARSLLHRAVMKTEDALSYAFVENAITAAVFIPLLTIEFSLPGQIEAWALVLLSAFLWSIIALVSMKSYKHSEVSIREPVSHSRIIIVFFLSVFLLSEAVMAEKIAGTLLIFAGMIIITYERKDRLGKLKDRGVQLTLVASILMALVTIVDKYGLNYFAPGTYGFIVYVIPAAILGIFASRKMKGIANLAHNKGIYVLAAIILGAVFYYFNLKALEAAEASIVFPVIRMSTMVAVLGGIIFLGERKDIAKKLASTIIIIAGAVLLAGL